MNWKLILNRLVMWSIKNHWVFLVLMVGFQYVSGKMISGEWPAFGLNLGVFLSLHKLNGSLIGALAGLLALEKLYLFLLKKGKI